MAVRAPHHRLNEQSGFSLLEVIVTLLILAAASAVILGLVRQNLDYAQRAKAHQKNVTLLLNRTAMLATYNRNALRARPVVDALEVYLPNEVKPVATVRNYSYQGYDVPVSMGYSPFQIYTVAGGGVRSLVVIDRSLSPPE